MAAPKGKPVSKKSLKTPKKVVKKTVAAPNKKSAVKKPDKKKTTVLATTKRKPAVSKAVRKKPSKKIVNSLSRPTLETETVKNELKTKAESTFLTKKEVVTLVNKKKAQAEKEVVVLPANISLRAKSKVATIASLVAEDFYLPARKIASVAGICFVVFGAVLSISNSMSIPLNGSLAQLIGSSTARESLVQSSATDSLVIENLRNDTSSILLPEIVDVASIPNEIIKTETFMFSALHVADIEVYLQSESTLKKISLKSDRLLNDRYQFVIEVANLPTDSYVVKARLTSLDSKNISVKELGKFKVRSAQTAVATNGASTTTEPVIATKEEIETVATTTEDVIPKQLEVKIKSPVISFTKPETLQVVAPLDSDTVTLFIRKNLSTTLVPLGRATKSNLNWLYLFDPINTPNGIYEVVAKVLYQGKLYTSQSSPILVAAHEYSARVQPVEVSVTKPESETAASEEDLRATSEDELNTKLAQPLRPVISIEKVDAENVVGIISTETDKLLFAQKENINELLRNYSAARQSGDEMLLKLAKEELIMKQKEIINEALRDTTLNGMADDIDESLTSRLVTAQEKIDTFEELRRNLNNNKTADDTDGDGISDFDELNLYGTDPESADSDKDGITDGIEIFKGFNPLNSNPEAIVRYESPKETLALVDTEILVVETISPVVRFDVNPENPPVQAEIRGTSIPNSFATLYIFSTPTVVTVKTDSDGSFVYTFENELEDGEHEVYVAITDNTGGIVAQSNPFKFVKEAQAFTTVGGEQITPISNTADTSITENPYLTVVGLGVLALGLVLLMLGIGLNAPTKESEPVLVENTAT